MTIFHRIARRKAAFALWLVLVLAAVLRFYRLDAIPPGLSTDDAVEGAYATAVLDGQDQIFFPGGGGREPLFAHLVAIAVKFLGPTTLAVHLPAALAGLAAIPALFLLAREMFDGRVALVSSSLVAISYWQLHESRTGQRAILVPLIETLAFYFFWRGWKSGRATDFAFGGALLGLTLYTYNASRSVPIITLVFLAAMIFIARGIVRARARPLAIYATCALLVFAPLGMYFWLHPESFAQRMMEVSSNELGVSALLAALGRNLLPTLGMFSIAGDAQWKYNLSGRPVFDWLGSLLFYAGIALVLWRWRKPESIFLLLWFAIGLLPGALSDESPHFLRTIVTLPVAYLFLSLGLIAAYDFARVRWDADGARIATILLAAFFVYTGAVTVRDYFGVFANSPEVYHLFYGDLAATAEFLLQQDANERAYLSVEYLDLNETVMRYYLWHRPAPQLRLFNAGQGFVFAADRTALYLVPATAPAGMTAQRWLDQGTPIKDARAENGLPLFRAYRTNPSRVAPKIALNAALGNAVELIGYDVDDTAQAGGTLSLALYARPMSNAALDLAYKFFAHLVDRSGYEWSNDEGIASDASNWLRGEQAVTQFHLPIPPDAPPKDYLIEFGLYSPTHGRVPVVDAQGRLINTTVASQPLKITRGAIAQSAQIAIPHRVENILLNELRLLGYEFGDAKSGEPMRVTLYWQAAAAPSRDYTLMLALSNAQVVAQKNFSPAGGEFPTTQWRAGEIVRDSVWLDLPAELEAGDYTLSVRLADSAGPGDAARIAAIRVAAPEHRFTIPPIQNRVSAMLGDAIEFLGYDVASVSKPGDTVTLVLYWRARQAMQTSYTVFTHLIDRENRLWGQRDRLPIGGERPTTGWVAGEVLVDRYRIPVAPDAPPGVYAIEIGMYNAATLLRLPVFDSTGQRLADDRILIGGIQVNER